MLCYLVPSDIRDGNHDSTVTLTWNSLQEHQSDEYEPLCQGGTAASPWAGWFFAYFRENENLVAEVRLKGSGKVLRPHKRTRLGRVASDESALTTFW